MIYHGENIIHASASKATLLRKSILSGSEMHFLAAAITAEGLPEIQ